MLPFLDRRALQNPVFLDVSQDPVVEFSVASVIVPLWDGNLKSV